jgi:NTP pyrophosphatase (non-canonical NTP hydrolase)
MNNLNELSKQIYEGNKLRGFDVSKENIGQTLMLVVSELSEALEADRKDRREMLNAFEHSMECGRLSISDFESENINCDWIKNRFETTIKDTFEDEIADSFIRLFDLCGGLGINIEKHIDLKLRYNSTRPFKHGKRY